MRATRSAALSFVLASQFACAPGGIERIEHFDAQGHLRRVALTPGASPDEVTALLGRPNAIKRGPGVTVYWLYTYDHIRHSYVLTFRGGRLMHVRYMPRPGETRQVGHGPRDMSLRTGRSV